MSLVSLIFWQKKEKSFLWPFFEPFLILLQFCKRSVGQGIRIILAKLAKKCLLFNFIMTELTKTLWYILLQPIKFLIFVLILGDKLDHILKSTHWVLKPIFCHDINAGEMRKFKFWKSCGKFQEFWSEFWWWTWLWNFSRIEFWSAWYSFQHLHNLNPQDLTLVPKEDF